MVVIASLLDTELMVS